MNQTERKSITAIIALLLFAGFAMLASCEKYNYKVETIASGDSVYFQTEVQTIFTDNCIFCHKETRNPDLRNGNSYNSLSSGGYITSPYSSSVLYRKISSNHPSTLSEIDKAKILAWILQGAKNN